MRSRVTISSQQILRDIYTPGTARVCLAIRAAPEKAFDFTYLGRAVGIVTDGSAIAALGHIGLRAGLPVLEGKAALFASLVGISGIPILVESASVDHFVEVVCAIAPSFGAILLEDIGSPRCFEIEQKLRARLALPVLHGDQHETAIVTPGCDSTDRRSAARPYGRRGGPRCGGLGYRATPARPPGQATTEQ
jgi:malate dehydrogenase (oxaloacetate-decarboxylating)